MVRLTDRPEMTLDLMLTVDVKQQYNNNNDDKQNTCRECELKTMYITLDIVDWVIITLQILRWAIKDKCHMTSKVAVY